MELPLRADDGVAVQSARQKNRMQAPRKSTIARRTLRTATFSFKQLETGALLTIFSILAYVAVVTPARENLWAADAWEHQAAIRSLAEGWYGNPIYATDDPSIRYSPYTLGLAWLTTTLEVAPFDVLSAFSVLNGALLFLGVYLFLKSYSHERSFLFCVAALLVLYGEVPLYANSLALANLPIHLNSPSSFCTALALLSVWWIRRWPPKVSVVRALLLGWIAALAVLSHAMTGLMLIVVNLLVVATSHHRRQRMLTVVLALLFSTLIEFAWPLFDFKEALSRGSSEYWFRTSGIQPMLTWWLMPALLLNVFIWFRLWRESVVRLSMIGSVLFYVAGLASLPLEAATLARLPLAGAFFLFVSIGVYCTEAQVIKRPLNGLAGKIPVPLKEIALSLGVLAALSVGSVLQLNAIVRMPFLGRGFVAGFFNVPSRDDNLNDRLPRLLKPVGPREVILSDLETSWPLPAYRGRIVAGIHNEFFVDGQEQRAMDVALFFSPVATREEQLEIIHKYDVKYLLLNEKRLDPLVFKALERENATLIRDGSLVLVIPTANER